MELDKYYMLMLIVGIILAGVLINFTIQPVYDIGCCTFNGERSCDGDCEWDGECTQEMEDECCQEIRYCSGQMVDDPLTCYDKYCVNSGYTCQPEYQIETTNYKCTCKTLVGQN